MYKILIATTAGVLAGLSAHLIVPTNKLQATYDKLQATHDEIALARMQELGGRWTPADEFKHYTEGKYLGGVLYRGTVYIHTPNSVLDRSRLPNTEKGGK